MFWKPQSRSPACNVSVDSLDKDPVQCLPCAVRPSWFRGKGTFCRCTAMCCQGRAWLHNICPRDLDVAVSQFIAARSDCTVKTITWPQALNLLISQGEPFLIAILIFHAVLAPIEACDLPLVPGSIILPEHSHSCAHSQAWSCLGRPWGPGACDRTWHSEIL